MTILNLIKEDAKKGIDIMEHKELVLAWSQNKIQELNRYGMTEEDFFNDFWIKFETHKGQLMEAQRIHGRNTKAFIRLLCNRHLIDLRRINIKKLCQSIDVENMEGTNLADSIEDIKGIDFSLMFEMLDSIPNKKATKRFTYKEIFQIVLDEGNDATRLADILNVSHARVSQVIHELIRYIKA